MVDFYDAINIIKKYEGFTEKATPDPTTGADPYFIGYGTQYYPDGTPVKKGQRCTEHKALEYLLNEVEEISDDLDGLNLGLDACMKNALISFIHSVGWEAFLYGTVIDSINEENWGGVAEEITHWIFDEHYRVIGNLIDRRREESCLFLQELGVSFAPSGQVLINAFRQYQGLPYQQRAIQALEENSNPYVLAAFANTFSNADPDSFLDEAGDPMYTLWD